MRFGEIHLSGYWLFVPWFRSMSCLTQFFANFNLLAFNSVKEIELFHPSLWRTKKLLDEIPSSHNSNLIYVGLSDSPIVVQKVCHVSAVGSHATQ